MVSLKNKLMEFAKTACSTKEGTILLIMAIVSLFMIQPIKMVVCISILVYCLYKFIEFYTTTTD